MADLLKKAKEDRDSALWQKAKIVCLIMGDENTKYFHSLSNTHIDQTPSMCSTWVRKSLATRLGSMRSFKNTTLTSYVMTSRIDVSSI